MKSFKVDNFLEKDLVDQLKKYVNNKGFKEEGFQKAMSRYTIYQYDLEHFTENIENKINNIIKSIGDNQEYKIGGVEIVKYQIKDDLVPSLTEHVDPGIWWDLLVSLPLDCTIDWPIVVEDIELDCKEGDAAFIYSNKEKHYRPKYPSSNKEDYFMIMFCWVISKEKHKLIPKNTKAQVRNIGSKATLDIVMTPKEMV